MWQASEGEGEGVKRASAEKNKRTREGAKYTRGRGEGTPARRYCFLRFLCPEYGRKNRD